MLTLLIHLSYSDFPTFTCTHACVLKFYAILSHVWGGVSTSVFGTEWFQCHRESSYYLIQIIPPPFTFKKTLDKYSKLLPGKVLTELDIILKM